MKNKEIKEIATNDHTKDILNKNEIFSLLSKIKNEEATYLDVFNLAKLFINDKKIFPNSPKIVEWNNITEGDVNSITLAQYITINNSVQFSLDELNRIAEKGDIISLLNSIGHEMTHLKQDILDKQLKKQPKIAKSLNDTAKKIIKSWNEIDNINDEELNDMAYFLGIKDNYDDAAFSRYLQKGYEAEARLAGLHFSNRMLDNLINDAGLQNNDVMKKWLIKKKDDIKTSIEKERVYRTEIYPVYKKFLDIVDRFSNAEFEKLSTQYNKWLGNLVDDGKIDTEKEQYFLKLYSKMSDVICQNKNMTWLTEALATSIQNQDELMCKSICSKIKNDKSITKKEKETLSQRIERFLTRNDVENTEKDFKMLSPFLSQKKVYELATNLIFEKKVYFVKSCLDSFSQVDKNYIKLSKEIIPLAEKMLNTNHTKEKVLWEDFSAMQSMLDSISTNLKFSYKFENKKNSLEYLEISNQCEELYNKLDILIHDDSYTFNKQDNEYAFRQKYGEKALNENKEKKDRGMKKLKKTFQSFLKSKQEEKINTSTNNNQ